MRRSLVPAACGGLVLALALCGQMSFATAQIDNPAVPAHGRERIEPTPLWALGGASEREEEFFGVVRRAALGADGTAYLLDEQLHEVRAFDTSGALVTVFGREGGGPGEFMRPRDLFLLPDGRIAVVHGFPARISTFLPDGAIGPELSVGSGDGPAMIFELQAAGSYLVAVHNRMQRNDSTARITRSLVSLDRDGRPLRTYLEHTEVVPMTGGRGGRGPGPRMLMGEDFLVSWSLAKDGRLYLVRHRDRYEIEVLDAEGLIERTLRRDFERVRRTAAEVASLRRREAGMAERGNGSPRPIDPYRDDIARVVARADGSVWVLPSSGLALDDPSVLATFDVFDAEGRFVRQLELAVPFEAGRDEFVFVGDALFVFEQSVDAARGMMAGRRGAMFFEEAEDDEERDPEPLRVVRYQLPARS